jgi:hypothetical protein
MNVGGRGGISSSEPSLAEAPHAAMVIGQAQEGDGPRRRN